jgi:hypothetical protein
MLVTGIRFPWFADNVAHRRYFDVRRLPVEPHAPAKSFNQVID